MPPPSGIETRLREIQDSFLGLQFAFKELETQFRWFRNIMLTLYMTIIAPLVVAIFISVLEK